ncbi:hypothetical protein [Clostridium sp.]|uniref:hypothetical protein n=1 Tax=Clostridium sp. TaxID=1506 RepID=UPI003464A132
MDSIKEGFFIAKQNIRKWTTNPRMYVLVILITIFLWSSISPILRFSNHSGIRVTPWIFPHLASSFIGDLVIMLGIVLLFCDAPFIDEGQPYVIIRSGRYNWIVGQIIYIMLGTIIYILFVVLISILISLPNIFLSGDWGKLLNTFGQTNVGVDYGITYISNKILSTYSPIKAMGVTILLQWCAGTILGLLMFIININFNRGVGAIVASTLVLLDGAIYKNFPNFKLFHVSPVSLSKIALIDPTGLSTYPTNEYAYIFFAVTIILLIALTIIVGRKKAIHVLPPL